MISPYQQYCDGYGNPVAEKEGYFIGFVLGTGVAPIRFYHQGSFILDEINAFDLAETSGTYIGQINMSIVSSFCGPQGQIWGYDCVKTKKFLKKPLSSKLKTVPQVTRQVPVYSATPFLEATKRLFGTRDKRRFPLMPGSHVPCAGRNIKKKGPAQLYCAFGLGVAKNPRRQANLLMEDVGEIPYLLKDEKELNKYKLSVLENIAKSVAQVGINQRVAYREIWVAMEYVRVEKGKIGCALVAVPYFTLAQKAIPDNNFEILKKITLEEWEKKTKKNFPA